MSLSKDTDRGVRYREIVMTEDGPYLFVSFIIWTDFFLTALPTKRFFLLGPRRCA